MKRIITWFSTPYYFNPNVNYKLKVSFLLGLFIFLFLYIFKPFNLSSFKDFLLNYTLGIGLITAVGSFCMLYIPPLLFKNYFNEDNWNVGKNIILILVGVVVIGSILWYFAEIYKEFYNIKKIPLSRFLGYTFLVASLPLSLYIIYDERQIREKRQGKIKRIKALKKERDLEQTKILQDSIKIYSDNKREHIKFNIIDLIYVTCQGNYTSFFLKTDDSDNLKELILRITLTKTNESLKAYPNIIRCHKSYIINSDYITDIKGNARGYLLKSKYVSFLIPVSRSFSKQSLLILSR